MTISFSKTHTFNEPRSKSIGSSPMENISRMIVEKISVSTVGRRGTVKTSAADTNVVIHRRPDNFGSRSAYTKIIVNVHVMLDIITATY